MSTYLTVLSTIFKYLAECGDNSIVMQMKVDQDSLTVIFTAYEKRSWLSRMIGDFFFGTRNDKPWSTYTSSCETSKSSHVDEKPEKITKFEIITVKFSREAQNGYNRLVDQFFKESDNVDQKKLLDFLSHLCNPNASTLVKTTLEISPKGNEFIGYTDRLASDDYYGYGQRSHYYTNYEIVLEITE